jgi:hypothetical protein
MLDHPLGELPAGVVGACSFRIRRRRSRLRVTAKPIENAS